MSRSIQTEVSTFDAVFNAKTNALETYKFHNTTVSEILKKTIVKYFKL